MGSLLNFWLGIIFFIIFSIGLIVDIFLVIFCWDKWPKLIKKNLDAVPWILKDVFKICLGLIVIYLVVNLSGYIIFKINPASREEIKPIINITGGMGVYALGIWFVVYFLRIKYQINLKSFGIKWYLWLRSSLKALLFYLGFIPILILLTYIGLVYCNIIGIKPEPHPIIDILKKEKSVLFIYYLITAAVIIAPVFEEILFRGLFYQALKKQLGFVKAAIISSSLFSLMHFNTAQFLPVLGLGTLFCFIFEYTGSLVPAIVLHIFNNGLFLGLFFLLKEYL